MRVLVLHNRYRQPGGEDRVVASEVEMLRSYGIEVEIFEADNNANAFLLLGAAAWSGEMYEKVRAACRKFRPDVAHLHNFWMALTPAAIGACRSAGVPVVQSLHNFRLLCANALFLRDGKTCTDCLGKTPWRGIVHRCYNNSAVASAAVVNMIESNRRRDTWSGVDAFITPTWHARSLFVAAGFDAKRICVKPNFVEDPGPAVAPPSSSQTIVYAGRLSAEKGLRALISAWHQVSSGELVIIGDGPGRKTLTAPRVTLTGARDNAAVIRAIQDSRALVLPSLCFETFGNAIAEAYACGRPVIVSDIGALGEIVHHRRTGLKFQPGHVAQLSACLTEILNDAALADRLGENARSEYLACYTPRRNFQWLMEVYERVASGVALSV
jgi:glycosyltransferase involved in cell wall biosynthesis